MYNKVIHRKCLATDFAWQQRVITCIRVIVLPANSSNTDDCIVFQLNQMYTKFIFLIVSTNSHASNYVPNVVIISIVSSGGSSGHNTSIIVIVSGQLTVRHFVIEAEVARGLYHNTHSLHLFFKCICHVLLEDTHSQINFDFDLYQLPDERQIVPEGRSADSVHKATSQVAL